MSVEIKRLHLASLRGPDGLEWPVHGFVVTHPGGAVLVDTGVGGPPQVLTDWRVVNRSVADALAGLDMTPGDIALVINTHLHFDHCGQNAVFKHAAHYVQRAELERAKRESPELYDWFGFMNARFELLDGDADVLPGLSVIATPGHTVGAPVRRGQVRRRRARPDDRRRGLHAPPVPQAGRREPAARSGERPGELAGVGTPHPLPGPRAGALLSPHRRHSRLTSGTAPRQRRAALSVARKTCGIPKAGNRPGSLNEEIRAMPAPAMVSTAIACAR